MRSMSNLMSNDCPEERRLHCCALVFYLVDTLQGGSGTCLPCSAGIAAPSLDRIPHLAQRDQQALTRAILAGSPQHCHRKLIEV